MKLCLVCEGATQGQAVRCGTCGTWLVDGADLHFPSRRGEGHTGNPLVRTLVDGKYRLQAVLGRGGLGTVFAAQHVGSLLPVAIKLLHPRFAEQPEYRAGLLAEARRAASVLHERCARLLDVGETEQGVAYLAMELVDGDTLELVADGVPLAAGHAAVILLQVAEALVAIHAVGLVHCDLSPRNVMVSSDSAGLRVKVLDFGIARTLSLRGRERTDRSDATGFFNPVFSAPELLAGEEVDARADLFSLGMLARLLLLGALPAGQERGQLELPRGTPRRLSRLVARCLEVDRTARPESAQAVVLELRTMLRARQPILARAALLLLATAGFAHLLAGTERPAFLRARAGSTLELAPPSAGAATQHRTSAQLHTLGFYFGGFRASLLQCEVSRDGRVLLRHDLAPEVDAGGSSMVLSIAQSQWRQAIESLAAASRDGPVDLSFVVPGRGAVAVARVQLDDARPEVDWELLPPGQLHSGSLLRWQVRDEGSPCAVAAELQGLQAQPLQIPLPGQHGEVPFGAMVQAAVQPGAVVESATLQLIATDAAGNGSQGAVAELALVDLAVPSAVEVTGPAGEAYLPIVGETLQLRVRLSTYEAGCRVQLLWADGRELAVEPPNAAAPWTYFTVRKDQLGEGLRGGKLRVRVSDAVGNRSEQSFNLPMRERDLQLRLGSRDARPAVHGTELVIGPQGALLGAQFQGDLRLVQAAFVAELTAGVPDLAWQQAADGGISLAIPPLPPGRRRISLTFEQAGESAVRERVEVDLRVLPEQLELRLPPLASRFLADLLQAGWLTQSEQGLQIGPGWRIAPELVPYLRGTLWVGGDALVALPIALGRRDLKQLMPPLQPLPGRNRLALQLQDVLGRPVLVVIGDQPASEMEVPGGRAQHLAEFFAHDGGPEPIGEVVLVEHELSARVWLRTPIAYRAEELPLLRLGIGQAEVAASALSSQDPALVRFDVPFGVWAVATDLADLPRERYAEGLDRQLELYLASPLGRKAVRLQLRTARSTLRPLRLQDVAHREPLLEALRDMRLLPVLAPEKPFAAPIPNAAPPRALFRPQAEVVVRNLRDFFLQETEFTLGQARALLAALPQLPDLDATQLVHSCDPLGVQRLRAEHLLPLGSGEDDQVLTGVDYFSAYAACRVLGALVDNDPELFRLPFGCELELAAFRETTASAHAASSQGPQVSAAVFTASALPSDHGFTLRDVRAAGDWVRSDFDVDFLGLDFGAREWVADLPQVQDAELLLAEWRADHATHRQRAQAFARGAQPPAGLVSSVRRFAVVRGLGFGEADGLLDAQGQPLSAETLKLLPLSVPGVLRSEQLRADGRDLLSGGPDPRLAKIGFRVAGGEGLLDLWRGKP